MENNFMTQPFKIGDYWFWTETYEQALRAYYLTIKAKNEDCIFMGTS